VGVLAQRVSSEPVDQSRNLPARTALEGRILEAELTPGKYGSAVIAGVQFGVTKIELRLGAVIFECTLMRCLDYTFTIYPGSPVRIYGVDGQLVIDHEVPGLGSMQECRVRPGDLATIYLPCRVTGASNAAPGERQVFDNHMHIH
jgi:hypothetical protein